MPIGVEQLPTVNATLNALAAVLLLVGWAEIKAGRERSHKVLMFAAFFVSIAFLTCYLIYHYYTLSVKFAGPDHLRPVYYTMLLTHVVLAAAVPFLAIATIYLGLADRRVKHRQLARWTFPIWLYVSVTGVLIYVTLYHLYPGSSQELIIDGARQTPVAGEVAS